jgi:hypothetical protein
MGKAQRLSVKVRFRRLKFTMGAIYSNGAITDESHKYNEQHLRILSKKDYRRSNPQMQVFYSNPLIFSRYAASISGSKSATVA